MAEGNDKPPSNYANATELLSDTSLPPEDLNDNITNSQNQLPRNLLRRAHRANCIAVSPPERQQSLAKSLSTPLLIPADNTTEGDASPDSVTTVFDSLEEDYFEYEDKAYFTDLCGHLHEFYKKGLFCDVEINVGDKTISCHKLVLACFSSYFRSMFTWDTNEARSNTVTIKDIDSEAFVQLVNFAYTAKIILTTENVQTLLYACSILQIERVQRACCEFMTSHLEPSNCIGVRNFADQHGQLYLVQKADEYILQNFSKVISCDEFSEMSPRCLQAIIESDDLTVQNETQVFEAVMKWVKLCEANMAHLPSLLSKIRLTLLPTNYLINCVGAEPLLRENFHCRDLLDEAMHHQLRNAQLGSHVKQLSAADYSPAVDFIPSLKLIPRKSYAGVIFCVGGRGASGNPFKTIECYDVLRNHWFQVAEMSTRRRHVGVVTVDGKLYAIGGHDGQEHLKSGEVFDPAENKWRTIACMSKLRRGIALAYLNGPIYAVGGLDDMACFSTVERYDPQTDSWSLVQPMNYSRGGVAVVAYRGYIYAVGGNNGAASLETCEKYDPHLNKWTMIESMHKRRAGAGVAELDGYIYAVGGFDDNSPLDSAERYDPETKSWTVVASMSCPRGGVGIASLGGKLYAVGGHDGTNYLSSVESYDPVTERWTQVANIGTCRAGAGVAVVACQADDLIDISTLVVKTGTGRL